LHQVEGCAFAESGLTALLLPNSIHFLSGSAIVISSLNQVSFWPGPCEFRVQELFIEDIAGRSLVCYFGRSSAVVIQSRIELVCAFCFACCESLESVTFEPDSRLQRIDEYAFAGSGLTAIIIPSSVELLCKECFSYCHSLTLVTFDMDSKLRRIDEYAFAWSGLTAISVPSSVEVLCKRCFSRCESLTSITFEMDSKLREVAVDSFEGSLCLHPIEYPPRLSERSQVVVAQGAPALPSSIVDME
jgi:hypothetical protein